ncbi:MAG: [Fe-Fe] hydrogenase large subunit C-terminal domain-containing protein [Roseburia sp.]
MKTFHELYLEILKQEAGQGRSLVGEYDPDHMDCLLHPEKYAPVVSVGSCGDCAYDRACRSSCVFDAITDDADGKIHIDPEKCAGCGVCVDVCRMEKLAANKDVYPVLRAIRGGKKDVYALIAPAFTGQFQEDVTPGRLRAAFKALGFKGMVEVAVFADILTLKEALEFDRHVQEEGDFQLTSCCCPVWIAMIRKVYKELLPHVPGAVSPMIAAGRVVKRLHPEAMTVFIGPCMAKKKEAREPDIADAVDYVLTFQEVQEIFAAAGIRPEELPEDEREHSSRAGRIYARTGGVSEAVARTVEQLHPDRPMPVRAEQADGVPACRALIARIQNGETDANFFEGMGCNGGCVGGPKALVNKELGRAYVDRYGDAAVYRTPLENPYVIELLIRLGYHSVEDFLEKSDLFARDFA